MRIEDQFEEPVAMPQDVERGYPAADRAARKTLERSAVRVVLENAGNRLNRLQWANAPTPGSVGSAIPGGYTLPEVNSLSAWTLISDETVSLEAAS